MGGKGKENELKGEGLGLIDIPIDNGEERTQFSNFTNLGNNQGILDGSKKWKRMEGNKGGKLREGKSKVLQNATRGAKEIGVLEMKMRMRTKYMR